VEHDFPQMKLLHRYSPSCMQVLRQFPARVFLPLRSSLFVVIFLLVRYPHSQ
jgi:hypothetical protein